MVRGRRLGFLVLLGFAASSITFGQVAKVDRAKDQFVATVTANFSAWDANGNGILEDAELARAVQDPKVTGDAAAAAATLKSSLKNKKGPTFPDWTRDYFRSSDPSLDYLVKRYRSAKSRLAHAPSEVLAGPELALKECKQGSLGDCYLVAATGAAIARDPGIVGKMIRIEPDLANYVVKYPDGAEVRVPALTQGEIAMGGAATKDGLWLRILEKAWGVRKISGSTKIDPQSEPIDAMGHGGSVRGTLEAMTGHSARSHRLGNSKSGANVAIEKLRSEITDAVKDRRLIGASTPTTTGVPGINGNHAYAILDYDSQADTVTIWNPHVNRFTPKGPAGREAGYPTVDGVFSMPLADFIATFGSISIETDQAKPASG